MRVRIKNDLSKWNATRELRIRPTGVSRKRYSKWKLYIKEYEAQKAERLRKAES